MQKLIFPALIVLAVGVALWATLKEEAPDESTTVKLPLTASEADGVTPYLGAAARELGHSGVRSYDRGVFVKADNANIAFTEAKDGMQMHVAFESKYRIPANARTKAVEDLKARGEQIVAKAREMKARDAAAETAVARND